MIWGQQISVLKLRLGLVKNANVNTNSYLHARFHLLSAEPNHSFASLAMVYFLFLSVHLPNFHLFIYKHDGYIVFLFSQFPSFWWMDIPYFMSLELLGGVSRTLERLLWFSACKAVVLVIRGLLWKWNHQDPFPESTTIPEEFSEPSRNL